MLFANFQLILILLISILSFKITDGNNAEARLHQFLFSSNTSNSYNKNLRPVLKSDSKILIEARISIKRIFEMDETNHRVVLFAVLFKKWTDDFLQWKPSDFEGIEYTYVDYSKIWNPQLQLVSKYVNDKAGPSDDSIHEVYDNFPVKLFFNGTVQFTPSVHLSSECLLNYGKFPFDVQMCLFIFQMPYNSNQIRLSMNAYYTKEDKKYDHMWEIDNIGIIDQNNGASADLQITFKRKTRNYLYTLPSYFVHVLTLLMFILPQTSNQRIVIGSTCLTISCLLTYMMSNSVPNHEISAWPLLGKLFLFNIVLLTFSILFSVFIINISRRDHLKSVPDWLRKLTITILARVFCIQAVAYTVLNSYSFKVHDDEAVAVHEHINAQLILEPDEATVRNRSTNASENTSQETESSENVQEAKISLTKYLRKVYENIDQIRYRIQIDTYNTCKNNEWLLVGTLIDRILFFVYCAIVIYSTLSIFRQEYH